MIAEPLTFR